jgi:hypothetical protein
MRIFISIFIAFSCININLTADEFKCSFAKGRWDPASWILVKTPRWEYFGGWVQKSDCIENETPKGATPKELLGKYSHETYSSMVTKSMFKGNVAISAEMEFTDRMAPLIVIAQKLGKSAKGIPEYREHFEIVIFDKGVNVWHHYFKDGKPTWKKAAYSRFTLMPNKRYTLKLVIKKSAKGKLISLFVDGHEFGYIDDSLPDEFHVGITGCEGLNKFYNFKVTGKVVK